MKMSNQKKRIYQSETRQAQAVQTRRRIIDAAKALFQAQGFEGVTIEQMAQAAEVSAPTIYALFQSKRGVLRALMDEALPPEQHAALVEQAGQEPSVEKRLAITAKIARQLYDAERTQMDIFRGAPLLAPELKEFEQMREQRRYERLEGGIARMIHENVLTKELTPSQAHDVFWAFTGRDMYRLLVIERGWSSDEYEKWLARMLVRMLVEEERLSKEKALH
jgi:AcrR family transcriptional regulator